jgi:agmatinase
MQCDATHSHFNVSVLGALRDAGDLPLPNTRLEFRAPLNEFVL